MNKKLNQVLAVVLTIAALVTGQTAFAENGWDIQASHDNGTNITTFTISRTNTVVAETVYYRLVNQSAFAGQHYYVTQVNGTNKTTTEQQTAALSGTFTFAAGETEGRTIQVTESTGSGAYAYYKDNDTQRSYKLEVTDAGGFYLTSNTRSFTKGTQFSTTKVSKSITNLVKFNSSGEYTSDLSSSKYMDVSYTPPSSDVETSGTLSGYVLIDDSYDYANKPATVSTSTLINSTGADAAYLNNIGYKIYATVCFTEKERDDGYQYVQILAGTSSSSYDTGYDPDESVNTPVNSVYKACFELSNNSNAEGKAYFPHRGTTTSEFSLSTGKLWQQAFKSDDYNGSGSIVLAPTVSNITTRFDAGGKDNDTWGYKDFFVRMALVDGNAPTKSAISVAPGYHATGNTVYVSVAFNEIVTVSGTPTLSTNNNWGSLSYVAGSGTNVLTFSKTIPANASGNLNITGLSGTVKDLAGNDLVGSGVTATGLCSLDANYTYTISYELNGGSVASANPTSYNYTTATITLNNPTKTGYTFDGWTGSNGNSPQTTVKINQYSHGNKSYTANWTANTYTLRLHHNDGTNAYTDQTLTYDQAANIQNVSRTGYHITSWTTNADGTGTTYAKGQSVSNLTAIQGAVIDLYAQWDINTYTVAFNANDGIGTMDNQAFTYGEEKALTANTFTRIGYSFNGWRKPGNADTYSDGQIVCNLATTHGATVTLYAQWTANHYTVRFHKNNDAATGTMADQEFTYNAAQNLTSNGFSLAGHIFVGWNTQADGSGTTYSNNQSVIYLNATDGAVIDLYAQWFRFSMPTYIDADGREQTFNEATPITSDVTSYGTNGTEAWYYVTGNVSIESQLTFKGPANIILCDGATLTITTTSGHGIYAHSTNPSDKPSLAIYGQRLGTGTLDVTTEEATYAIYANRDLVINGGNVTARAKFNHALYSTQNITINGGNVSTTANNDNAIHAGLITINGGTVNATSDKTTAIYAMDDININRGTVSANGYYGLNALANVTINGGIVTAQGSNGNYAIYGSKNVTINGGNVTATGSSNGIRASSGTLTLGWTNASDRIYASNYSTKKGTICVKEGQILTDGTNTYEGTLSSDEIATIAGQTLRPAPTETTETKALAAGWNWFSTYCENTLDNLKIALVEAMPGESITIQSQTQYTKYNGISSAWKGQLSSLDVAQMYIIQVSSDCEITLEGYPIDPAAHPVTIHNGDNWIGFPFAQNMSVANAFEGFAEEGDIVISQTASACYSNGTWKGTLKNLEPGQGYIYKSAATGDRTFTYPAQGGADSGSNGSFDGESHWSDFNYHSYQYNRPVVAAIMIDGQYVTADDYDLNDMEVAAFVGDECRGNRFTLTNRYVVNDGEPYPVLDGMPVYYDNNGGEEVTFMLYNHVNGIEYTDCEILYDGDPLTFYTGEDYVQGWMNPRLPITLSFHSPAVDLVLSDTDANANAIEQNNNRRANVTISGRSLSKSGEWNTLCLPFSLSAAQIAASPLAGAIVKEQDNSDSGSGFNASTGVLTLKFKDATSIVAGKPYIVKWDGTSGSVSDPVFTGVTISSTTPTGVTSNDGKVTFVGQYSPFSIGDTKSGTFDGDINEIILLSTGNKLGYSKNARTLKCFRCHFYVPVDGSEPAARSFVVDFGDESTGISLTPDPSPRGEGSDYYTLDGRKLSGKPTKKGMYIVNGKKVVIK